MAEIEPNDDDVFEIDDFTVVSPLETLVSAVEVAIHDMNLEGSTTNYDVNKLPRDWELEVTERRITYESNTFLVRWFRPNAEIPEELSAVKDEEEEYEMKSDSDEESKNLNHYSSAAHQISSPTLDFCTKNNLCAMYGVVEFLVLVGEHSTNDRIATMEQKDFVMSAVRIALNNTNCELPFFVLCGAPERELYFGSAESRYQTMSFLPAHLHQILPRHTNLTGLISLMKEKVRSRASVVDLEEVQASIRFEYQFQEPDRPRKSFAGDEKKLIRDCRDCRHALELSLVCLWTHLPETRVHENESFSNLEPADSSHWEIHANFHPRHQPFAHILKTALAHCLNESSPPAKELFVLPPTDEQSALKETTKLMDKMSLNKDDWSNLLGGEVLSEVIDEDRRFPSWSTTAALLPQSTTDPNLAKCLEDLRHSKAAPPRSIAARLAVQMSHVMDDESDVAVKWISFVRLLRQHWENNKELPGLSSVSAPNLGSCIFNQKLEMLQCCIKARLQRMACYENHTNEEFFDAEEHLESAEREGDMERAPSGREKRMGEAMLHRRPDVPLYVPNTQMPCPMTEDMVQAHAEHLSTLREGAERTEAQLGLLRSDMQAFKAANPGCDLIDFIRWHSPKDFDEETGELSDRMRIKDNAWERCWREATPLPAIHQQPHFNEATVAEGILSVFEHATVAQVADWILPILFHQTTLQLINEDGQVILEGEGATMCSLISRATRDAGQPAKQSYYKALHHIRKYERLAHFHGHLWKTFWRQQFLRKKKEEDEIRRLVREIMKESDIERTVDAMFRTGVRLPGAASHFLGEIIAGDFQGQNGLLQKNQTPLRKSYVLYWNAPVPSPSSRIQPQRIFANIEYENHRICSATTNDVVFS
ncbi:hypothetical protein PENTCL1PPCAC_29495 [Pristionchus entomophagus]|uniref:Rab3 GTPase-activating protein catalytic subunit n=1 Tax=Pristionchus entomophagus TaxID=358040 RepID=A0AAV5UJZ2_9BILA|nr:hypothetical protein PENTCL1PPCAC_29495 [Pristionchus entomophagus]